MGFYRVSYKYNEDTKRYETRESILWNNDLIRVLIFPYKVNDIYGKPTVDNFQWAIVDGNGEIVKFGKTEQLRNAKIQIRQTLEKMGATKSKEIRWSKK